MKSLDRASKESAFSSRCAAAFPAVHFEYFVQKTTTNEREEKSVQPCD
jgi:hypothetical protein